MYPFDSGSTASSASCKTGTNMVVKCSPGGLLGLVSVSAGVVLRSSWSIKCLCWCGKVSHKLAQKSFA